MAAMQDEKIAQMKFGSIFPHYMNKIEKKGRTAEELHQVIEWLTGGRYRKFTDSEGALS